MSYEGINHKLCARGHYAAFDALTEMYEGVEKTCHCGELYAHEFDQDQTNGEETEYPHTMPPKLKVKDEAKSEKCNLGHFHVIDPPTYHVPDDGLWREIKR